MVEYKSNETQELDSLEKSSEQIKQYVKFYNKDYALCESIEKNIIKHGHLFNEEESIPKRLYNELDGYNMT